MPPQIETLQAAVQKATEDRNRYHTFYGAVIAAASSQQEHNTAHTLPPEAHATTERIAREAFWAAETRLDMARAVYQDAVEDARVRDAYDKYLASLRGLEVVRRGGLGAG